jgi:hypothetical protein
MVDAGVGDGQEVRAGSGPVRPLEVDEHVADVVADPRRPRRRRDVLADARDEGPNRITTAVWLLAFDLERAVREEQVDELVETAAVDAVRVPGDGVPDLLACRELPRLHLLTLALSLA